MSSGYIDQETTPLLYAEHHNQKQQRLPKTLSPSRPPCCGSGSNQPTTACCSSKKKPATATTKSPDFPVDDEEYCHLADQKWEYKAVALLCALLIAVGSHFAAHTLGAMKNTIKEQFQISNAEYGVIQSSVAIVNTVLPLIGGIFVDAFGTIPGSLLTTLLITSGNILVALSISSNNLTMLIMGRVFYGIGSGTVVIVQETILSQWFRGRSLAGVVALMLTVSRLASFTAQAIVVPIADWTGWYGYGFWFSAMLCVFSFIVNLIYIALLRSISNPSAVACRKQTEVIKRKKSFSWKKLLFFPHSYWLIAAMEFSLGGGWGCFLHINSEFVKLRFDYTNAQSAATASVAQILPVFLMPILGLCVDKYGKRTWMMVGSGVSMLVSMLLLGYTNLAPFVGMLIFSLSLSLGPVGLVSSVPVILPLSLVGTGLGLIKSWTNIGLALFDIVTGWLQDQQVDKGYDDVILFFIGLSVSAIICGLVLTYMDRHTYNNILDRSAREAHRINENKLSNAVPLHQNNANWVYSGIYFGMAALTWILFFRFVLFI